MDYDRRRAEEWLDQFRPEREPIILVLTTHLSIERILDHLIENTVSPKAATDLLLDMTFARKLRLVLDLGLITKPLHDNISKLNNLRNKYAHELDVDLLKADLRITNPSSGRVEDLKRRFSDPRTPKQIQTELVWLGMWTFGW